MVGGGGGWEIEIGPLGGRAIKAGIILLLQKGKNSLLLNPLSSIYSFICERII